MLDDLSERFSQRYHYESVLSADQIKERIIKLLAEPGLFGDNRFQGYADDHGFSFKDTIVTKSKTPPIINGRIQVNENQTQVTITYQPTDGLLLRFLASIPMFLVIVFLVPNDSASGSVSVILKTGFALLFCGLWNLITYLNARESFKSSRQLTESTLQLKTVTVKTD